MKIEGMITEELFQIVFPKSIYHPKLNEKFKQTNCVICLEDYEIGEQTVKIPICEHKFHEPCLYSWIMKDQCCPICKIEFDSYTLLYYFQHVSPRRGSSRILESEEGNDDNHPGDNQSIENRVIPDNTNNNKNPNI